MSRCSRRGPWLPEEDNALVELVRTQGPNNWVRISQQLQFRSPKQCRERYHQNLKPSLNHEPISTQEGEMIEQLVNDMGKRWAEIARRLGNRSDNAVKNWWNGSMNRRKRNPSHGSNFKHIGNRAQPIHCGKDFGGASMTSAYALSNDRPKYLQLPHLGSGSEHITTTLDLPSPGLRSDQAVGRPPLYHQPSPIERSYSPYQHQDIIHRGHPLPSRIEDVQRTQLPPLRLPPLSNHASGSHPVIERSSVSPAASEFTNCLYARHPPSLISDTQSSCSISPKTIISPRLNTQSYYLPYEGPQSCAAAQRNTAEHHNHHTKDRPSVVYDHVSRSKTDISHFLNHDNGFKISATKDSRLDVSNLLK